MAYGNDLEKVRALLLEVAVDDAQVLKLPQPEVYFEKFGDSALNFELAVWTEAMSPSPRRYRSDLNFVIERKLREANIEISFPQRIVRLRPRPIGRVNHFHSCRPRSGAQPC